MNSAATLEWERRWALRAALCAFAGAGLFVIATVVRGDLLLAGSLSESLRSFDANRGVLLVAAILRSFAFIAFALPLYYLFRAASSRSPRVRKGLVGIVIAGPLVVAALDVLLWIALSSAATEFTTPGGGAGVPVGEYAEDVLRNQGIVIGLYQGLTLAGNIAFTFGIVYTCLWAMRTGLLTRFMGTLGIALGAAVLLLQFAQFVVVALMFWMAWIGVIILGRLPGGRPLAWETGEARPWPKAGDPPPDESGELLEEDEKEEEARGFREDEPNPNAARRERAKKRKRKRRSS